MFIDTVEKHDMSKEEERKKLTLISAVARETPMHFLGPAPQGAYPSGSFLHQ